MSNYKILVEFRQNLPNSSKHILGGIKLYGW